LLPVKNRHTSIDLSPLYFQSIDLLINDGLYENQEEVIKDALRKLFNHYEVNSISDACTDNCDPLDIAITTLTPKTSKTTSTP
jgi:Arc/MetJ-type ribon-helix-helix transcriptional regulator